jgi:hypothetical protein
VSPRAAASIGTEYVINGGTVPVAKDRQAPMGRIAGRIGCQLLVGANCSSLMVGRNWVGRAYLSCIIRKRMCDDCCIIGNHKSE